MPLWAFWEQPLHWPAPHFTCATNNPDYIFLWHSKPAPDDRWASSKGLQLARVRCNCLPQQHAQLWRLLLSFPKRKLRRQVCTNCVIHETYVSQRLTNLCFVPNPICHSSSFYATIPYNFWYLYYKVKNVTWWFAPRGGLFGSVEVCWSSQILASFSSLWAAVSYAVHVNALSM